MQIIDSWFETYFVFFFNWNSKFLDPQVYFAEEEEEKGGEAVSEWVRDKFGIIDFKFCK